MVYLAGVYWPMKATEWDTDKVDDGDINFTGGARVWARSCRGWSPATRGTSC
jgi:hypothetical protein